MLYEIHHYTYSPITGPGYEYLGTVGSITAARLKAQDVLAKHPVVTTNDCYHRDVGRAPSVGIFRKGVEPARKAYVDTVSAPVHIVSSVGELGWTP